MRLLGNRWLQGHPRQARRTLLRIDLESGARESIMCGREVSADILHAEEPQTDAYSLDHSRRKDFPDRE